MEYEKNNYSEIEILLVSETLQLLLLRKKKKKADGQKEKIHSIANLKTPENFNIE